jgi:hypothetical protein
MNNRWVCKRCFADNEESSSACQQCGLIRGAESTAADQAGWATQAAGTDAAAPDPGWRRWIRYWWIPALVVVLAVGYFANARRSDDGSLEAAGTLAVDEMRAGDCFNAGEEESISDVDGTPCTEAHEYQVFAVGNHEAASYPSDPELETVFTSVCEAPFQAFVGMPYEDSELYANMITPSEESWADGDRSFICFLYDPNDSTLTASMEGAGR